MSVKTFNVKTQDGKEIVFSRPYVNDEKELTFLNCNEFTRFPNMQFVLSENNQSIELRHPNSKKKVFLLLKGNEHVFNEASKDKETILNLLRVYTKSLKTGSEKIIVKETQTDYPFYFTTATIEENGNLSSKFVAGFIYFLNQKLEEKKIGMNFTSFDQMQLRLGEYFKEVGFDQFQHEKMGDEEVYTISFNQFIALLS